VNISLLAHLLGFIWPLNGLTQQSEVTNVGAGLPWLIFSISKRNLPTQKFTLSQTLLG